MAEATPAPRRFLPAWDNSLIGQADRRRFVREEDERRLFGAPSRGAPLFMVDGYVDGAWRLQRQGTSATLRLQPFRSLTARARKPVRDEAERLLRILEPDAGAGDVRIDG